MGFGYGDEDVHDAPDAFLVDDGEVEGGAAGVFGLLVFAGVLAGEQAAGEGAPDEEAGLFGFEERDYVALEVAAGDGVVGLQGVEAGEVFEFGDAEGFGDLPGEPIGDADVTDFALLDESIEGAEGLFDGGDEVVAVDLVEVDVVGLEAAEAGVDGVHDVTTGGAYVVFAGAGASVDLGGDDDAGAGDGEVFDGLTDRDFGPALGVDIGGVDEVDAGFDGYLDEGVDVRLADLADVFPNGGVCGEIRWVVAGEGHGAETDLGDEETSVAESFILHAVSLG